MYFNSNTAAHAGLGKCIWKAPYLCTDRTGAPRENCLLKKGRIKRYYLDFQGGTYI